MTEEYSEMWRSLGLNLEAHDALLAALGQGYKDIFMTQENRPKGMQYFDFVVSQVHGLRIKELLDENEEEHEIQKKAFIWQYSLCLYR